MLISDKIQLNTCARARYKTSRRHLPTKFKYKYYLYRHDYSITNHYRKEWPRNPRNLYFLFKTIKTSVVISISMLSFVPLFKWCVVWLRSACIYISNKDCVRAHVLSWILPASDKLTSQLAGHFQIRKKLFYRANCLKYTAQHLKWIME